MSATFRLISWTPYKKRYDLAMLGLVFGYLALFFAVGKLRWRGAHAISDEVLALRALGTCAFIMLNIALGIGPLARLSPKFLPLLYNRRHLGVATFFIGLLHAVLAIGYYHGFGRVNPVVSAFTSNVQFRSLSAFPFELLGMAALLILFAMAATSHDIWLKKLTPRIWKRLHMLVYLAWAMLVLHIALGALRSERNPLYAALLVFDVVIVSTLHIIAGHKETNAAAPTPAEGEWLYVCAIDDLQANRGKTIILPNRERIALFLYDGKVSALSNVCAHQGGPLGEGRIIGGCVTCPWHGYQYRPGDGCAPPPFTEKLPTYQVRIRNGRVLVSPVPNPPGTPVDPAPIHAEVLHAN